MSPEDMLYDNDQAVKNRLVAELEELKMLIDEFDIEQFTKVKRYGLPVFEKDLLQQYYEYVDGLFSLHVEQNPEQALKKLATAMMCPEIICH